MVYDVIIIGGGASGLTCALLLGKANLNVLLLEGKDRVGKKILVTGNGRCNFTNMDMNVKFYHSQNPEYVESVINRYPPGKIIEFFNSLGLAERKKDGLVYPLSNQASSVLDALRLSLGENVNCVTDTYVNKCLKNKDKFEVHDDKDNIYYGRNIIIATGSKVYENENNGYKLLENFGHKINKVYPALVPLKINGDFIKGLKGCKYIGSVKAFSKDKFLREEKGEILFTEYGLSGIAVMQLAYLHNFYGDLTLELNFVSDMDLNAVENMINIRKENYKDKDILAEELLTGLVNKKIGVKILKENGVNPALPISKVSDTEIKKLAKSLNSTRLKVSGTTGFKNAQVCGGGVSFEGFDINTLESKLMKGLYATGEILDVFGGCGGYNLHFAWSGAMFVCENIRRKYAETD